MMRRLLLTVLALLVVAGVAAAVSLITPMRKPPAEAIELPRATSLTCPVPGTVVTTGSDDVTSEAVGDGGAVRLHARGDLAAGAFSTAGQPRTFAPCATPTTTGVLLVDDPSTAQLVLTNSDVSEANVDLRLIGPAGELEPVGARGIAIAPGVTRPIALSVLAPTGPVAVLFSTSQGRVAAAVTNVEGRASRVVTPTRVQVEHLIPGIPADASSVKLMITNPREDRVQVQVSAFGPTSEYEPASTAGLTVAPMTSVVVDLGADLGGEATALRVAADGEIAASVVATSGSGAPQTLVDATPAPTLIAAGPGLGAVLLTNAADTPATATVAFDPAGEQEEVTVAPKSTTSVAVPAGAEHVRVDGGANLVGSVVAPDAAGSVVIPLVPAGDGPSSPGRLEYDPALR